MLLFGIFKITQYGIVMSVFLTLAILLITVVLMQPSVGLNLRAKIDNRMRGRSTPISTATYIIAIACTVCTIWLTRYNLREAPKYLDKYNKNSKK